MGRRTILLTTSVLLAGLGTLLVFLYAQSADRRASRGQTLVTVLFATATIPAGTSASQAVTKGWLEPRPVPQRYVPGTAVRNAAELGSDVAVTTLTRDMTVVRGHFGSPTGVTGQLSMPRGKMALTVELTDPERVAGLVRPQSDVAVFATVQDPGAEDERREITGVLLPSVRVLRVGQDTLTTAPQSGALPRTAAEDIPKQILTLAVNATEAQKLIYAKKNGQLYLALRGPDPLDTNVTETSGHNLFRTVP